jgi:hypothetical protein
MLTIGLLVSEQTPPWVCDIIKRMPEIDKKVNSLKVSQIQINIFQPAQSVLDKAGAGRFSFKRAGCDGVVAFYNPESGAAFGMDLAAVLKEDLPTLLLHEKGLSPPARIRANVWGFMLLQIKSFIANPPDDCLAKCAKFVTYLQGRQELEDLSQRFRSEFYTQLSNTAGLSNI